MTLALNPFAAFRLAQRPQPGKPAPVESTLWLPTLAEEGATADPPPAQQCSNGKPPTRADRSAQHWWTQMRNAVQRRMRPGAVDAKQPLRSGMGSQQAARAAAAASRPRHSRNTASASRVMRALGRPFAAVAYLLSVDVSLLRDGKALHIVIARKRRAPPAPLAVSKAIADAQPMHRRLKQLLDLHPMTRRMMRHLGYFEGLLATQGLTALTEMPIEVLSSALEQLDTLVTNWSDCELADLRSRMAVALKERSQEAFFGQDGDRSNFMSPSRLLVDDASHSQFLELERQYQGLIPQDTIRSALSAAIGDGEEPVSCELRPEDEPVRPAADSKGAAIVHPPA
ncbi:hypothetical protein J2X20_003992 [Pelomonas saccharophila]|uniref:Uncharacterized protein n=1 Tax=Roseateles saccharophilus TaxID=304 RepID=A0ABU1YR30_ROSSA|nr:hypothetical protein [Roseateles saccharophilus]MDR7271324.1 hypothetical protein [Roseateles saccharophilus]